MKEQFKAFLLAGFLCAIFGGAAQAQSWCNGTGTWYYYYDGSYSPYQNGTCHGWTTTGSGHVFGVNMYWNSAGRAGVQSYVGGGRRYTHDITDLNNNLSATGTYSTNFPSPYIDFDDDNGNSEWEEAEVTVENSNFPTVGTRYYIQFWFSWAGAAGNAGNVAYTPAISEEIWYTSDKWDTYRYDKGLNRHYTKTGNLFDGITRLPTERLFGENENEKQYERRRFEEPLSIENFRRQTAAAGVKVSGYALEYEVDSEDGPQIVTVGLVPTEEEFVPSSVLEDVFRNMPDTFTVKKLRGVVSYYHDPVKIGTEK